MPQPQVLDKAPGNVSLLTAAAYVGGVLYPIEVSIISLFEPTPEIGVPPTVVPALAPLSVWLGIAAPDIIVNSSRAVDVETDDIRGILYHELAHSIHFLKAGDAYWLDEIIFTILHNGYGNGNTGEPTDVNGLPLLDNVTGITRKDIFNTMGSGTVTVQFQRNEFQSLLPSRGISQASYDALNAGYGL